ncbi:hypothetical protein C0Q70_00825 [Pomacea canaliculata]|uniref:Uncharacterized protein n=1 Tax=Pomacea canaliculata TaxID=400727 RepID=A0A2T7PXR6_POMCA|nr:hypothetical protein C0Q70_00825 [Pomacea canaliculata]
MTGNAHRRWYEETTTKQPTDRPTDNWMRKEPTSLSSSDTVCSRPVVSSTEIGRAVPSSSRGTVSDNDSLPCTSSDVTRDEEQTR